MQMDSWDKIGDDFDNFFIFRMTLGSYSRIANQDFKIYLQKYADKVKLRWNFQTFYSLVINKEGFRVN
jgi:hypothetical protein